MSITRRVFLRNGALAVVGTAVSSSFQLENAGVEADLDQTHTKNTFRACGANDGVHLTVWRGIPLEEALDHLQHAAAQAGVDLVVVARVILKMRIQGEDA